MNIDYKCKFCSHEGSVAIADDYPKSMIHLEVWIPKLCCNRCGHYMESKRKLLSSIGRACFQLQSIRWNLDAEKTSGLETKLRTVLEALTKRLCALVCDYYHQTNVWDAEFYHSLLERPDESYSTAYRYINGVARF